MADIKKNIGDTSSYNSKPKRIAMYVIYDKDGILDGYRKYYLQELKKVTDYILVVVSGTLTPESRKELDEIVDEILVRENKGLLAGSWIDGIAHIGWEKLYRYDELLMLNDSFFGPFYPLEEMFDAMEKSDADFYGAFKNYEEKNLYGMEGRRFKYGYLRGSICYFYVIKTNLLHSNDFKNYWSKNPKIEKDVDTYFFAEFDFYDYLIDHGFKIDSYQSDLYKGYMFDNLTHNMNKLVENDKIPFARIRPFGSDMKAQSLLINYGKDPRETLDFVNKNTSYDTALIWEYILRTKNLTDIYNQMQLEYVLPKYTLEKEYTYNKPIAVVLHIYYIDLVKQMAEYCFNFPDNAKFYITTTDDETFNEIIRVFDATGLDYVCKVRPNVGVAISTLWITFADVVLDGEYEYICYFHDKKSPYTGSAVSGAEFGRRCYENLMGTKEITKNIINIFEDNPCLGMVGAPAPYHGMYFGVTGQTWGLNYKNTVDLAKKLDLKVDISPDRVPVAPYGDMFWFRSDALKKAVGCRFQYKDFDFEYRPDGTILHAIERIYGYEVQDAGYFYANVINTDDARSDLVNYEYIIEQTISVLRKNGYVPYNFLSMINLIEGLCTGIDLPKNKFKSWCKLYLKPRLPNFVWNFSKKVYFLIGGK